METHIGASLERFKDQEKDCRDKGNVGNAGGGIVRQTRRV
jgi:hypothetical protein